MMRVQKDMQNKAQMFRRAVVCAVLLLAGCASGPGGGIYVPAGERPQAPKPPLTDGAAKPADEPQVWRKSEQPPEQKSQQPTGVPGYRESGDQMPAAAAGLVKEADTLIAQGNGAAAITRLERAQRIAPRSAAVYFKLSEAYVMTGQLASAEQFTLKGLSLAGRNERLQRSGWLLLADIRKARGNVAGAQQAESRAARL
ncbi:tetratricopeptide repeat protein [Marinobacter sp. LV10MA510-1]|uniref:tetratricopeptide repeat protein n=1 Tax=Marinobacter sp. LV10MA510-1 TaxID=1415567 RepID=UPI000C00E2DC|nr:tetratricopeptide repeat protein [Marinobacter sp. LV10MA510-1]PFG09995.1 tetratricopeptide repeat protein [Marinobacter sp. LV10MA510-1]